MDTSIHHPHSLRGLLSVVFVLGVAGSVSATPVISVGDGHATSWTDAMAAGNIRVAGSGGSLGVLDPSTAAYQFYNSPLVIGQSMGGADPIAVVNAAPDVTLYTDVPVSDAGFGGSDSFDSLVMDWGENPQTMSGEGVLNVAAWDYVYDVDPDLTGLHLTFSLLAPPGVWDFSLELFDVNNNSIGWFGVPPGTTWASVTIDPSIQMPQGPFTAFFANGPGGPGAFDLTKVAFIRLNESSQTGVSFGTFPVIAGGPIITGPWNAWNHIATPEPASLLLLALGLVGLAVLRERDSRRLRKR